MRPANLESFEIVIMTFGEALPDILHFHLLRAGQRLPFHAPDADDVPNSVASQLHTAGRDPTFQANERPSSSFLESLYVSRRRTTNDLRFRFGSGPLQALPEIEIGSLCSWGQATRNSGRGTRLISQQSEKLGSRKAQELTITASCLSIVAWCVPFRLH